MGARGPKPRDRDQERRAADEHYDAWRSERGKALTARLTDEERHGLALLFGEDPGSVDEWS